MTRTSSKAEEGRGRECERENQWEHGKRRDDGNRQSRVNAEAALATVEEIVSGRKRVQVLAKRFLRRPRRLSNEVISSSLRGIQCQHASSNASLLTLVMVPQYSFSFA